MNLAEKISLDCGLKILKPHVDRSFMPIHFDRFIIFDSRSKYKHGRYDFFNEVYKLIKPSLDEHSIKVVQICEDSDAKIPCDRTFIKINKKQEAYIISKSELFISNDNYSLYTASALNKPSVGLYSVFDSRNSAPIWNKNKQIILESDREGNKPTYNQLNESPKTINFINPYEVASNILNCLNIENSLDKIELVHLGEKYNQQIVEIVPDFTSDTEFLKGNSINLRLDLVKEMNGQSFAYWMTNRRVNILTNKDLNISLLKSFRKNIIGLTVLLTDDTSENFLKAVKSLGIKIGVYCSDADKINDYRFKLLDWNVEKDFDEKNRLDEIKNISEGCKYESSKIIISKGNKYASKAAYLAEIPLDKNGNNVILNKSFEEELDYFKIYNETETLEKK